MILLHILAVALSVALIVGTFLSALRTFVAPRAIFDRLTTIVFVAMRHVFDLLRHGLRSDEARDRLLVFIRAREFAHAARGLALLPPRRLHGAVLGRAI